MTKAVLKPSMSTEFSLMTPLSTAAATGDFALFNTVSNAVDRCLALQAGSWGGDSPSNQLDTTDARGMTLVMHAARSGNVAILGAVLRKIIDLDEEPPRLLMSDYRGRTVLMHAAGSGRAAVFTKLFYAIEDHNKEEAVKQLLESSDDDRTILMHAARSGNQMALSAVVHICKKTIKPKHLRNLLQKRDGTGMTFLMHAARGYPEGTADQLQKEQVKKIEKNNLWKKNQPKLKLPEAGSPKNLATDTPSTARRASAPAGLRSIPKSEGTVEGDGLQSRKPTTVVWGDFPGTVLTEAYQNNPGNEDGPQQGNTPASESLKERDEDDGMKDLATENYPSGQENELVVFKVAWALVKETLWKEQVRDQLKATDSSGRSILTHAVLSDQLQVFDAAFCAVREQILDHEIEDLMGINKDDDEESVMEAALDKISKKMEMLVHRRDQQLKKKVALREKASTIEAKIQSFIPGKSIVIFQLLLPEMNDANSALFLLVAMSVVAPLIAYGSNLVLKETPSSRNSPRRSVASILLAAPAMWWWGVGTSSIAQDSFGWLESSSATSLAVATIVIPALDQFLSSHMVENVYDVLSGQRHRFTRKADLEWKREHRKLKNEAPNVQNDAHDEEAREKLKVQPQDRRQQRANQDREEKQGPREEKKAEKEETEGNNAVSAAVVMQRQNAAATPDGGS
ncbi:unnamed protein product [Ascophyllum nodosum]